MKIKALLALVALLGLPGLYLSTIASAADCPCDCYFSGDCEPGNFCNWGVLSQEDSCFWRRPKPQGQVGAGCNEDYNNWGQCDGICTPSLTITHFVDEPLDVLITGVSLWGQAFDHAALSGGGEPDSAIIQRLYDLPFKDEVTVHALGRIVIEALMLARGDDFVVFPMEDVFLSSQVMAADISGDADRLAAGQWALAALQAEMIQEGAALDVLREAQAQYPAVATNSALCGGANDPLFCLYTRLGVLAAAVSRGGFATRGSLPCEEPDPLRGDFDGDGQVNLNDFAKFSNCYSGQDVHTIPFGCGLNIWIMADFDQDQDVDLADFSVFADSYTG